MKKCISFVAGLVLFSVSACTSSTPVSENKSTTQATSQTTTTTTASNKPEDGKVKVDAKSTSGNTTAWQDYTSVPGKFSVQMPDKPKEESSEEKTDSGTIQVHMAVTGSDDLAYFGSYTDFPNKFADSEIQERLTGGVNGNVKALAGGELKSSKESKLGEIPCRDFEAVGKDQSVKGRLCIANNNRLYQVFTFGNTAKFSNADADRLIASFKINN